MLLFNRENWKTQIPWIIAVVAIVGAGGAWCVFSGFPATPGAWRWPSGSSVPGFTLGVAGGMIIAFEMLLWPRKAWWRGRRMGRTKHWMIAHLWLGVLVLPLLLMHGGMHFNPGRSTLAAVLMWLLLLVFLSGIFGAMVQNVLPRVLMERVPAETIAAQIDHVLEQARAEAAQLVDAVCNPEGDEPEAAPYLVVERVRSAGAVRGKVAEAVARPGFVADAEPLAAFHKTQIQPFLEADNATKLALAQPARADAMFQALRQKLPPQVHPVVHRLAELCDQRRQYDRQRRLNRWLHAWLAVHLPLSAALFVLMMVHIFLALKFV